jgi:hypothetical protein
MPGIPTSVLLRPPPNCRAGLSPDRSSPEGRRVAVRAGDQEVDQEQAGLPPGGSLRGLRRWRRGAVGISQVGTVTGSIFQRRPSLMTYARCASTCRGICRPVQHLSYRNLLLGNADRPGTSPMASSSDRHVVCVGWCRPAAGTGRAQADEAQPKAGSVVAAHHQRGPEEQHRDRHRLDSWGAGRRPVR